MESRGRFALTKGGPGSSPGLPLEVDYASEAQR